ncbi:alpha/beta fold hydrolase [Cohnella cholangitidis]|nr:alpha/beta hydrolase [Cohnella cholangitidis]
MAMGNSFSANAILPQTEETNLFVTAPEWKVPVYLFMGRFDYMTPSEVAYDYYKMLKAPAKSFVWFERSAHFPQFEEPDLFSEWMTKIKEETLSSRTAP